jgi:hypothetical protein
MQNCSLHSDNETRAVIEGSQADSIIAQSMALKHAVCWKPKRLLEERKTWSPDTYRPQAGNRAERH